MQTSADSAESVLPTSDSLSLTLQSLKGKALHSLANGSGSNDCNSSSTGLSSELYFGHNKDEVARLIMQALIDLGHADIASSLEKKTGLAIELPVMSHFQSAIIEGRWDLAEALLDQIQLRPNVDCKYVKFLIRRQEFLELLDQQNTKTALKVLRTKISSLPIQKDTVNGKDVDPLLPNEIKFRLSQISQLSNLVMYSKEDITKYLSSDDGKQHSRYYLLNILQDYVASDMMVPKNRLATLLNQAEQFRLSRWNYRVKDELPRSLISDYSANKNGKIVPHTVQKLTEHTDEVWFVSFSHNGKYLATASRDSTVIVWRVSDWSIQARLDGHARGVICAEWSPDDTKILTCGQDHYALLFDSMSGKKLYTLSGHSDIVSSCSWLPTSQHFMTASPDKTTKLWNTEGKNISSWDTDRILAMAITPNGSISVSITYDNSIHFCNLETDLRVTRLAVGPMNALTISADSRYALVHLEIDEFHLWDLQRMAIVRKYFQHPEQVMKNYLNEPENFVLRPCFGGVDENIVACGGVDGHIYLWNRETTNLLDVIRGHTSSVNCVQFNPEQPDMMASCSDDHTVRIWKF